MILLFLANMILMILLINDANCSHAVVEKWLHLVLLLFLGTHLVATPYLHPSIIILLLTSTHNHLPLHYTFSMLYPSPPIIYVLVYLFQFHKSSLIMQVVLQTSPRFPWNYLQSPYSFHLVLFISKFLFLSVFSHCPPKSLFFKHLNF